VAYAQLLPPRRKLLHRQVAQALEGLHVEALELHITALGLHCFEGELWDRAARHLRRAGARALAQSAGREAAACFERALTALGRLAENPETQRQADDCPPRPPERAQRVARGLGDRARLGRVAIHLSHHAFLSGRPRDAQRLAEEARSIAEELGDAELGLAAASRLGSTSVALGDFRLAEAALSVVAEHFLGALRHEQSQRLVPRASYV